MQQISSKYTRLYKRLTPIFWFGGGFVLLAMLVTMGLVAKTWDDVLHLLPDFFVVFVCWFLLACIYSLTMRGIVDEVWEDAGQLKIIDSAGEAIIPFGDIVNVNYCILWFPRVTVTLRSGCSLGREIAYITTWNCRFKLERFWNDAVIDALIARIDQVRISEMRNPVN